MFLSQFNSNFTEMPNPPYFVNCQENSLSFNLPATESHFELTADKMDLHAYDGRDNKLPVKVKGTETSMILLQASRQVQNIVVYAVDEWGRSVKCQIAVYVKGFVNILVANRFSCFIQLLLTFCLEDLAVVRWM